jgi:hypothetical protein
MRIVPMLRSVKSSSRYREAGSILSSAEFSGVIMGLKIAHAAPDRDLSCRPPGPGG